MLFSGDAVFYFFYQEKKMTIKTYYSPHYSSGIINNTHIDQVQIKYKINGQG